jgi:hypothetical protein
MKQEIQVNSEKSADVRELAPEEIDAVAGGMINNPFNSAHGQQLLAVQGAWLASVGIDDPLILDPH